MCIRLFLLFNALCFGGVGVFALLNTYGFLGYLGIEPMSPSALYELRSAYGGINLGVGLATGFGVIRKAWQRPALYALLIVTSGYALGRVIGLFLGPLPSTPFLVFGLYEALVAIICVQLLRSNSRSTE